MRCSQKSNRYTQYNELIQSFLFSSTKIAFSNIKLRAFHFFFVNYLLVGRVDTYPFMYSLSKKSPMFSFFQNDNPPYSVDRIKNNELLDKAVAAPVHHFFRRWMQKRPRKALVGNCFILHEDEEFIYWGTPRFKKLFSDQRIVDNFFKTSKKELEHKFPNYKTIWGNTVRLRVQDEVRKIQEKGTNVSLPMTSFSTKLLKNYIEVHATCRLETKIEEQTQSHQQKYRLLLDKNNLNPSEIMAID